MSPAERGTNNLQKAQARAAAMHGALPDEDGKYKCPQCGTVLILRFMKLHIQACALLPEEQRRLLAARRQFNVGLRQHLLSCRRPQTPSSSCTTCTQAAPKLAAKGKARARRRLHYSVAPGVIAKVLFPVTTPCPLLSLHANRCFWPLSLPEEKWPSSTNFLRLLGPKTASQPDGHFSPAAPLCLTTCYTPLTLRRFALV